jgi:hypothetical protein
MKADSFSSFLLPENLSFHELSAQTLQLLLFILNGIGEGIERIRGIYNLLDVVYYELLTKGIRYWSIQRSMLG